MTAPAVLLATLARRPASADPDADLLGRFAADGDPSAFEELVRRYARLVWRVARTHCRTDATAEDVFQATFAVLNRKAKTVRSPAALAGWLHRTAHRLAVRATRRERPAVPLPPDLPHSADPLDALTARELLAAVDDELSKLTDAERAVLLLCGIDGVSNGYAATRLGWSTGSVKGRLERARAKLRDRLSARGLTLPAVLVGLVGFAPPANAVDAAVALPVGGALSPSVAELVTETFTMKAKTALAAAVAGLFLLTAGVVTDTGVTPTADAAPVPKELKPLPKEAWGEAKGGLQAGLRMPDGATLAVGQAKELQVVVRNVGKVAVQVWYTPQQPGVALLGDSRDGKCQLGYGLFINGRMPGAVNVVLNPGEELVRWWAIVRHGTPDDTLPADPTASRIFLTTGTHQLFMRRIGGDLEDEFKPRDGMEALNFEAFTALTLGTGELLVRCLPPRPAPRRNAPVPKDAPRRVLWSEPVRVDWKGSGAESINGVWMPDGRSVLVPSAIPDNQDEILHRGGIDFRDAATGKVTKTLPFTSAKLPQLFQPTVLAVAPDGKAVHASGSLYKRGSAAETPRGLVSWRDVDGDEKPGLTVDVGSTDSPLSLSLDGKRLAAVSPRGAVELRETTAGRLLSATALDTAKGSRITSLVFHPTDGHLLASCDTGGLYAVETASGRQTASVGGLDVEIRAVAVSADGKLLAVGGAPGQNGHALATLPGDLASPKLVEPNVIADAVPPKKRINGLAFSPGGKHLAAACSDGVLCVFDVKSGKLSASAKEHKADIFSVAYSPDGKQLLTVGRDAMKVWDVGRLMAK